MACLVNGSTIVLSGDVGDMGWYYDGERGFTSSDVIAALAQVGDRNDVVIRLNSGGGIATEGSAIHAALSRHKGRKTVCVEGVAASAASVIAMAGDEVVMALGALLMIHDPAGVTMGTVDDHQMQINALSALGDAMATIYAAKSGQTPEACRSDMKAELWMTADQAVAKGYADRVMTPDEDVEPEPAPFNYTAYHHAPPRMTALAHAKRWDVSRSKPTATAAPPTGTQEPAVATEDEIKARETAAADAAVAAERERVKTEAAAAAAKDVVPATAVSRSDAAAIAQACIDGDVPTMTASLLAEGVTLAVARDRIGQAGTIKDMVALARKGTPAIAADFGDQMIAAGKSVDAVRAELFNQMVANSAGSADEGSRTMHRAGAGGADRSGNAGSDAVAKSKADMAARVAKKFGKKEG